MPIRCPKCKRTHTAKAGCVSSRLQLALGEISGAVYTSPHTSASLDPEPALMALVKSAKRSILFSAYAFTLADLAAAIIEKHAAGLDVRGIADASEYTGATSQIPAMVAAGVDVRLWGNTYQLNHEKVIIVDGTAVALGSYNFTKQAESRNKEVLLILTGKQVTKILAPTLAAQIQSTYAAGVIPAPSKK